MYSTTYTSLCTPSSRCWVYCVHAIPLYTSPTHNMPLLEVNRNEPAGISRRPSLGQQLKQKLLTRLASISSTIRAQPNQSSAPVDENNAPRSLEDDENIAVQQLRSTSSHPLERLSMSESNNDVQSQAGCEDDTMQPMSDPVIGGSMSLRRTVTLDDELFMPLSSGPSGNPTVRA